MSNNIFICQLCGKEYKALFPVGRHLKEKHNINLKEYYDKFIKKPEEGKCLNCGKPTYFYRLNTRIFKVLFKYLSKRISIKNELQRCFR